MISNCKTGDVRLVSEISPIEGRLEICINNAWGSVCRDSFSRDDAQVACRQLGNVTDPQQTATVIVDGTFNMSTGPIFLTDLECDGEESNLLSCGSPVYLHSCNHDKDVGVKCPGWWHNSYCFNICVLCCKHFLGR